MPVLILAIASFVVVLVTRGIAGDCRYALVASDPSQERSCVSLVVSSSPFPKHSIPSIRLFGKLRLLFEVEHNFRRHLGHTRCEIAPNL